MLTIDDMQVRWNAYYNLPYFYSEFHNDFPFKLILEELATNENEDIEILRIIASSIKHIFETADKHNYEDDFVNIWRIYENLLVKNDKVIIQKNSENLKECLGYLRRFINNDESTNDDSPHSAQSDNFT
jgi:hypothetical protein